MAVPTAVAIARSQPGTRNQEATIYVGNLDEKVTESLLNELFVQVAPVVHTHIPRDRITQQHQGYGFIEFPNEIDAEYAVKVMTGVRLYGKPLRINRSSADRKSLDVGANLFVGNLAPEVDEKTLFDTFILFGTLIQTPKVARDETTGASKGYAFLSYDCFEASDAAIESMNGQFLANRPITVNYAYKKDSKGGERHGTAAERLLAAQGRKAGIINTGLAPSQFAMQQLQMQAATIVTTPSMTTTSVTMNNPVLAAMHTPMMTQPAGPYYPMVMPPGMMYPPGSMPFMMPSNVAGMSGVPYGMPYTNVPMMAPGNLPYGVPAPAPVSVSNQPPYPSSMNSSGGGSASTLNISPWAYSTTSQAITPTTPSPQTLNKK